MRKYISAEMRVVRVKNNIIATSGVAVGDPYTSGNHPAGTPARKSIWE